MVQLSQDLSIPRLVAHHPCEGIVRARPVARLDATAAVAAADATLRLSRCNSRASTRASCRLATFQLSASGLVRALMADHGGEWVIRRSCIAPIHAACPCPCPTPTPSCWRLLRGSQRRTRRRHRSGLGCLPRAALSSRATAKAAAAAATATAADTAAATAADAADAATATAEAACGVQGAAAATSAAAAGSAAAAAAKSDLVHVSLHAA
jgi:hypothetical protein